jgi:hypothetical protein
MPFSEPFGGTSKATFDPSHEGVTALITYFLWYREHTFQDQKEETHTQTMQWIRKSYIEKETRIVL